MSAMQGAGMMDVSVQEWREGGKKEGRYKEVRDKGDAE